MLLPKERIDIPEWLDEPGHSREDVAASLRDVQHVNRFLAGTAITRGHLAKLLRRTPRGAEITVLDVATGSGDIPRALIQWGRNAGFHLQITCLDVHPLVVEVARQQSRKYPELKFVQGDARQVGFAPGSFDYVVCSMALHHFTPLEAKQILREMDCLSRRGWIVNDLRRSRIAWALIWLLTRLFRAHRLTQHDGPASTLRAYTPMELRTLAEESGLTGCKLYKHRFYRMALVRNKMKARSL